MNSFCQYMHMIHISFIVLLHIRSAPISDLREERDNVSSF